MKAIEEGYFSFMDLTPEEKEKRGILGRLYGDCADIKLPTRNGRGYSEEVFDNSFKEGTIASELLKNGGIPGECGHPADRTEIDMEKIAIIMPEPPRKDKKSGKLIGYWDILDTPCGRIAYQLAKYGFKLGISSRGTGDVETDYDGNEVVNPDTYDFQCFDLVVIPAVESARLSMVESLGTRKSLKESLSTLVNSEKDARAKEIMNETLNELHIDLSDKEGEDNKGNNKDNKTADDTGVELMEELQKSLKENKSLRKRLQDLQEKLSVCYTKEADQVRIVEDYKKEIATLKSAVKAAERKRVSLSESDKKKSIELLKAKGEIKKLQESVSELRSSSEDKQNQAKSLQEGLSSRDAEITKLRDGAKKSLEENKELRAKVETLTESVEELKKDSSIKNSNISLKLTQANALVEKYKKVANAAVDKYIRSQALRLGVNAEDIRKKLSEHYSLDEVDRVCEDMQKSVLIARKLPFATQGKSVRVDVKESKKPTLSRGGVDDEVDASLMELAGL